jgi:hypothetical protein
VGVPGGIEYVISNLQHLLPAIAEVSEYLLAAEGQYEGNWSDLGSSLLKAVNLPIVQTNEFLQIVILSLFGKMRGLDHVQSLVAMYDHAGPAVRRKIVLAAAQAGLSDWLRQLKYRLADADPWLKRAILWAARKLPKDEKEHWLAHVRRNTTELERAIVGAAIAKY